MILFSLLLQNFIKIFYLKRTFSSHHLESVIKCIVSTKLYVKTSYPWLLWNPINYCNITTFHVWILKPKANSMIWKVAHHSELKTGYWADHISALMPFLVHHSVIKVDEPQKRESMISQLLSHPAVPPSFEVYLVNWWRPLSTSLDSVTTTWCNSIHWEVSITIWSITSLEADSEPIKIWKTHLVRGSRAVLDVQPQRALPLPNTYGPRLYCLFNLTRNYGGNICVFCTGATEVQCAHCQGFTAHAAGTPARIPD